MNKIKLFCFPYAGGSSIVFREWKKHLHPSIELVAVELPGRDSRFTEAFYKDVSHAVDDLFHYVSTRIDNAPYAFFGHSMGSMLCYELAHKISKTAMRRPLHIFFSGRGAPHIKREDKKKFHLMDETEFETEVLKLGGTNPDFFRHAALLELFLPVLRNDFRIVETGEKSGEIIPLDDSITVLLGKDDDLTPEQCTGWKRHTKQICCEYYFEGGHFFLNNAAESIVKLINNTLVGANMQLLKNNN
jgi:medium-chain acyl-[acyl-carrier-protein] hydrolase